MPIGALVMVPDLQSDGVARLVSRRSGYLGLRFLGSGAEMTQEEGLVARHCLMPGTRVRAGEREGVIQAKPIVRDGALLVYAWRPDGADADAPLREDAITAVPPSRDPFEQLATVAFNDLRPVFAKAGTPLAPEAWGPRMCAARDELIAWRDGAWSASGGVVGLAGARVRPLPHQLICARRALADRKVRFLLADEVGLGKTIEAGLVVQSLLAARPDLRVLVIAPGALISQWFLELFVKFGGRPFLMLDGERLKSLTQAGSGGAAPRRNSSQPGRDDDEPKVPARSGCDPWHDRQFVIASTRAVEGLAGKDALRLATSRWDVLIVDECHRLRPGGVLAKRVAVLSKATPHVLLLSATPPRSHADAYLALLALLQPDAYRDDDAASFAQKLAAHDAVVDLLGRTIAAEPEAMRALAPEWPRVVPGDDVLRALASDAALGEPVARARLVAYVREHHQLDRRVIRHRRQVLARLAAETGVAGIAATTRAFERVAYKPDANEAAARAALAAYRAALMARFAVDGEAPPRLAHWLLQLELATSAHPRALGRMLAMRAAVVAAPEDYAEYRALAVAGETTAQVLRDDLSEAEVAGHIAVSAACHGDAPEEAAPLAALRAAVDAWTPKGDGATARGKALIKRLERFWAEFPGEKVLVFTANALAVEPLARALTRAFGESAVETFGAHQDTIAREDSARRFRDDEACRVLVSDPLGGEGRNFQFVSVVAHHDLPWSIAAVEQRIGRVDRLGRDGEVPSWALAAEGDEIDAAWTDALAEAVGVFARSSSGLEFAFEAVELAALRAALSGGAAALRAHTPALAARLASERDARDARADDCFREEAAAYAAAAKQAEAVAASAPPVEALARWIRGMGGQAFREEERPRAWKLRARFSEQPERGVFARDDALARPDLAFFGLGHDLVDRVVADADNATWCAATAWRRPRKDGMPEWEGLRVAWRFAYDLAPLQAAGVRVDALRRLLVAAPPRRALAFIRADGTQEDDERVLAALRPPFDAKGGDVALSRATNRDAWTRFALAEMPKLIAWQDKVRSAAAGARALEPALIARERAAAVAAAASGLEEGEVAARAVATAAAARLGAGHPEAKRLAAEAEEEARQAAALRAAAERGTLEVVGVAYVALA